MKKYKWFLLFFAVYPVLAALAWASGEMMPSGGTTMMGGGGMMSGDSMTRMMSQDLGNRQMMGQGMQNMDMKDMENMQKNQAGGDIKGSMPQSQASMNNMTEGEMSGTMEFHMVKASECEKSAEVAQTMVTYYEQMKKNDEETMGKMPKESQPDTYKNMMKHYDMAITNATRLKKDFEEMAKWHKAQAKNRKETRKKEDEGKTVK